MDDLVIRPRDMGGRRINGRPLQAFKIEARNGRPFGIDAITELIQIARRENPRLRFQVSHNTGGAGWRSAPGWIRGDADIRYVANPENYDQLEIEEDENGQHFETLAVYLTVHEEADPAGGCKPGTHDASHDCLIKAIQRVMAGRTNGLTDEELRGVAKVGPGVPIPATPELFRHIERRLGKNVRLEVSGKVSWTSPDPKPLVCRIRLHNQHFEPLRDPKRRFVGTTVARKDAPKQAAFLETASGVLLLVEGEAETREVSREDFLSWRLKPMGAPYGLVRCGKPGADPLAALQATLAEHAETREVLLPLGLDYYKAGGSIKKFALELWRRNSAALPAAEPLTPLEEDFISGNGWAGHGEAALRGGLVYSRATEEERPWSGEAVELDVRSMYPWIMASALTLPNSAGVPTYVANFDQKRPARGFYKAAVRVPEAMRPLWRHVEGRLMYFTHIDLVRAAKLGGTIEMAPGPDANAILYPKGHMAVRAEDIFGAYVKMLWDLRQKTNHPAVKRVLNILWGALCQRRKQYMRLSEAPQDLPDRLSGMGEHANGDLWMAFGGEPADRFKGDYPRFGPFITAQARLKATEMILEATGGDLSRLVRVHTDGLIVAGRLEDLPEATKKRIGPGLGQLKVEHQGVAHLSGLRKPRWA